MVEFFTLLKIRSMMITTLTMMSNVAAQSCKGVSDGVQHCDREREGRVSPVYSPGVALVWCVGLKCYLAHTMHV